MSKANQDYQWTDGWRGLAIISVVILHVMGAFPGWLYRGSLMPLWLVIDQLSRYCVPLFIALSGYGLAKRYVTPISSWTSFAGRRIIKIFPLYLVWTIISLSINFLLFQQLPSQPWWWMLVYGSADYPYYFIPLIFQFYIIFPFIIPLVQTRSRILLTISLIIQAALYYWYSTGHSLLNSDQLQYRNHLSWIFYFILGVWLAGKSAKAISIPKASSFFLIAIGIIAMITTAWPALSPGSDTINSFRFTRNAVIPYATGVIIFALNRLHPNWQWPALINFVGRYAFIIFLSHTIFIRIIVQAIHSQISFESIITSLLIWLIGISISRYL